VQKCPNGVLREAKIKVIKWLTSFQNIPNFQVDFDRNAHLSIRKITQRKLRRMCLEYERDKQEQRKMDESKRLEEMIHEEKQRREREERERVMRALLRAERRQRLVREDNQTLKDIQMISNFISAREARLRADFAPEAEASVDPSAGEDLEATGAGRQGTAAVHCRAVQGKEL
jgi:hypothetical protein